MRRVRAKQYGKSNTSWDRRYSAKAPGWRYKRVKTKNGVVYKKWYYEARRNRSDVSRRRRL